MRKMPSGKLFYFVSMSLVLAIACSPRPNPPEQNETKIPIPTPSNRLEVISPDNATQLEKISILEGSGVSDLVWDPNEKWLAVLTSNEGIKLHDPNTFQFIQRVPGSETSFPGLLAVSPDGKYLVSTPSDDIDFEIWDTTTWEKLYSFDENLGPVNQIIFSPNGSLLAYISNAAGSVPRQDPDHPGFMGGNNIFLVDPVSGKIAHILRGSLTDFRDIAFSPDGKTLASGSCCGDSDLEDKIQLWNTTTGEVIHDFGPSSFSNGRTLAISLDGNYVLSDSDHNAFNLTTFEESFSQYEYMDAYDIAFSPDGKFEAMSYFESMIVRETTDSEKILSLNTIRPASRLTFSPDGKRLAYVLGGEAGIWQLDRSTPLIKALQNIDGRAFALAPDGSTVAIAAINGELQLYDIKADQISILATGSPIQKLQFSDKNNVLLVGREDNSVEIWQTNSSKLIASIKDLPPIEQLRFGGSDSKIIISDRSGAFSVFSSTNGEKLIDGGTEVFPFRNYFLSGDGNYLVLREIGPQSYLDTTLSIHDFGSGKKLNTIFIPEMVSAFALTPDLNTLIFSTADAQNFAGDVVFYDLEQNQEIERKALGIAPSQMIVFDQGKSLAVIGDNISLWDIPSRNQRFSILGPFSVETKMLYERYLLDQSNFLDTWTAQVINAKLLSVSTQTGIIAASQGNTILLKDLNTGEELTRFIAHEDEISNLIVSSDGNLLVSGSENASEVKLWNIQTVGEVPALNNLIAASAIAFSPDHSTLVYSENDTLKFVNLNNSGTSLTINAQLLGSGGLQYPPGFGYSPDGKYLVTFDPAWEKLLIWESSIYKLIHSINLGVEELESIAFSSDSKSLAMVSKGKIILIDLDKRSVIRELDIDIDQVYLMAISPDNQTFTLVDVYGHVSVCGFADCSQSTKIEIAGGDAEPVALSRDGEWLSVIVNGLELQVWNLQDATKIWSHNDPDFHYFARPENFLFSPDGKLLVFPTVDGLLKVWETATGNNIFTFNENEIDNYINNMAFSQDGLLFATTTQGGITIWGVK